MSAIQPVELTTRRLLLWMPRPEHAAEMARYYDENRDHLGRWAPSTRRSLDEFSGAEFWRKRLARSWREYIEGRAAHFAISWRKNYQPDAPARNAQQSSYRAKSGRLSDQPDQPYRILGTCTFTSITRGPHQSCLLGYGLDQRLQGRGVMTEALEACVEFAFGTLELQRIMANYMPSNERSAAVLKRLGFVVEGYARDFLFVNGSWCDHILTALVNPTSIVPSR
ncbi:MAG: GNAT family N-acetyltransferase [Proteobacteria bacterium]|nr:GNAT family N-acetyltransferase [Pseudomonadota bacterium]